jgi:elongation factor Ts
MDKAVEVLRERGLAAAAKKAGRIAAEGLVFAKVCKTTGMGVVVEVNCETDFVAKNEDFQKFVAEIAAAVISNKPADNDALLACKYPNSDLTVEQMFQEKVLTIGENLKLRRFVLFEEPVNVSYVHMEGKIGVLVNMKVEGIDNKDALTALGRDVCMQIAAMRPGYLKREEVPADVVEKEKEILLAQTMNEGKPEKVAEKIVAGRIGKFFEENCLVDQAFVKENKVTVGEHVKNVAKELGGSIELTKFIRFEKGEGLQKREENFAAEIEKLAGGNK